MFSRFVRRNFGRHRSFFGLEGKTSQINGQYKDVVPWSWKCEQSGKETALAENKERAPAFNLFQYLEGHSNATHAFLLGLLPWKGTLKTTYRVSNISQSQCRGLSPAGNEAPCSRSLTPPPRWDGEVKIQQNLVGRDKKREGSLTTYGQRQKRLNFGGKINQFNLLPIKTE